MPDARLAGIRSLLFAPGHDGAAIAAALASGADAVIADLEDLVPAGHKERARTVVASALAAVGGPGAASLRMVRVNGPATGLFDADVALQAELDVDAMVLPKATAASVGALAPSGPPVIAVIESGRGLMDAYAIAQAPRVAALLLGANDLASDLRLELRPDAAELLYARSTLVAASAAAGLRAPFDRVYPAAWRAAGLEADAQEARTLGFGGKASIDCGHPRVVNAVFDGVRRRHGVTG